LLLLVKSVHLETTMLTRPEKSIVQETVRMLGHVTCDPVRRNAGKDLHRRMQRFAKSSDEVNISQAVLAATLAAYSPELREAADIFVQQNTNEVSIEMLRRLVNIPICEMENQDFEKWFVDFEKLEGQFVVFGAYFFQIAVSEGMILPKGSESFYRLENRLALVLESAERHVIDMCARSQFKSAIHKLQYFVTHGNLRGV